MKKTENKHEYYIHQELIVECMSCRHEHLRRQRNKVIPEEKSNITSILVCPKCGKEGYTVVGSKDVRRIKKKR